MNWDDYDAFCRVIEQGGFSAAARAMERPKSSISASVLRLEAALNARLLERTTRRVRPTAIGASLYQRVGPLFLRLREARADVLDQGDALDGSLRIAAPYEFGAHHLGAVACGLMARHPRLNIQIDVEHAPIDPLARQYDIVFALQDGDAQAGGAAHRVFSLPRGLFAAPALLAGCGAPERPQQLAGLPLLAASGDTVWTFTAADGAEEAVAIVAPRMRSSNADVRMQAALAGLGVARITATYCAEAVRQGRLQPLLPHYACARLDFYALLPPRRRVSARVHAFLDALGGAAGLQG